MFNINNDELIQMRRVLHRIPELSGQEYKTSEYIKKQLSSFGIPYTCMADTGVSAVISGAQKGKTILLRADIDALPIDEKNNLDFKSTHKGVMHACGHDIHTACVLYAGKILNEMKENLHGNVKLVFQPREETDGGAEQMINEGVMENPHVDSAIAMHVEPLEKCGFLQIKNGAVMASPDDFEIEISGRGGHGATPHECINPIESATMIIEQYHKIPSVYFSAQTACVVTVCSVSGGNCPNVIPDKVTILGTARSLDEETRDKVAFLLKQTAKGICRLLGTECKFTFNKRFPPTINDAKMNELLITAAKKIDSVKGIIKPEKASMCGDDFAYFAQAVPASYFKLGVGNENFDKPIHSPYFMADEKALPIGTAVLVQTVLDYLHS